METTYKIIAVEHDGETICEKCLCSKEADVFEEIYEHEGIDPVYDDDDDADTRDLICSICHRKIDVEH